MGTLSEILGNAGEPFHIDWNNKRYSFGLIDQNLKTAYEKYLFEREIDIISALKPIYSEKKIEEKTEALVNEYRDNKFSLVSPKGLHHFKESIDAKLFLLSKLGNCSIMEVTGLLIKNPEKVARLLDLVIQESFPGIYTKPTPPNGQELPKETEENPPKAE